MLVEAEEEKDINKKHISVIKAQSIERIESSKGHFLCSEIGLINQGVGLEQDYLFFNESPREFICKSGMGGSFCSSQSESERCVCPPRKWEDDGCRKKYSDYLKLKFENFQKAHNKINKNTK